MKAIDLFAGAGGFTTGAEMAGCKVVWAANHWPVAVEAHAANHGHVHHVCQDLHQANWTEVPKHDLLLASPCCHGHSRARGTDRPQHEDSRSTAWAVVSCAEYHRPPLFIVENVPEFTSWSLYPSWCDAMHRLGYSLAPHIVDAADHGVPQNRKRLFIIGAQSRNPLSLDLPKREHVPVATVIRWGDYDWSLVRRPGRSRKTLVRVARGRERFGERFVMPYYGSGSGLTGRSIHRPLGTLTTRARWAVVDGDQMRMLQTAEAQEVMGFPNEYRLPESSALAMNLLGNAVSPPVARDLIQAIKDAA